MESPGSATIKNVAYPKHQEEEETPLTESTVL